ncbi:nucleoside hydrolase [Allokutzneria albata]|uniref:Purine nucleosidase n=1 Tax=Allokutzneria albata TaxID=211114 RepID=A0A1H0BTM8_ALLAB|nr:nucleoside hydrolase [Allokutzneria albata]SDN49019.1 purine nucleosidase [Allokutzneria albata]
MRIVLDTDPGIDDALAILYLAAQPEVDLVGVGTVHGNVPADTAAENALRVLELVGWGDVPVAIGARMPMAQPLRTYEYVHGDDGLGNVAGPKPHGKPTAESAVEQLVRLARQHPGELDLLALGPLTNVAVALLVEPELPKLLRKVVVMGGAVWAPGNATAHAEANIYNDPEAADLVLGAGFDLTLVGLEATAHAIANATWLDELAAHDSPRARFASGVLGHYVGFYQPLVGVRQCTLYDPLAAAILLDPGLAAYRELPVHVELRGTHTRGTTVADLRGYRDTEAQRPAVKIAAELDEAEFLDRMLRALRAETVGAP